MTGERTFLEMIELVRSGDEDAARQLLARYEPQVRRIVRVRLTDPILRREVDSLDICQSVMAEFFMRVGLGQYVLETPQQLLNLLAMMARNRVINQARKQYAARRDARRVSAMDDDALCGPEATPSRTVQYRDLLEHVRSRLTEAENFLVEQRASGEPWAAIARRTGGTAAAVRMRLMRAIDRVSRDLNLQGDIL